MIARGFKSVIWVATVGGAALSCYMVSLRVATERNELARVERQIIAAKRDIRSLQTELGTRGRMTQLEQWNAEVLALSAPSSAQFLKDEFTLARLYRNDPTVADRSAEVRLASAATEAAKPAAPGKPATPPVVQAVAERPAAQPPLIHRASFTTAEVQAKPKPAAPAPAKPKPAAKPEARRTVSATSTKPEPDLSKPAAKPGKPAAQRIAIAATSKPEAASSRPTAKPTAKPISKPASKPSAKPEALRTAAATAKPVREAAATPRAKGKGGGGN
ncbi:MAG TPA: hypothetical protein VE053_15800 [Allosphingosinicella sp.]|nr:hypothetical protein [Allosphingosinicella sp.]